MFLIDEREKHMNVYDFDGTIYYGDSTADFVGYCIRKYPVTLLWMPITAWAFFLYVLGIYSKTKFKEKMYGFLKYVPNGAVECFWQEYQKKIKPWYRAQQKPDDVVISASPEFLIKPVCEMIGIKTVMASRVDIKTGRTEGLNCHDTEKVRRLYEWNPNAKIQEFYSDSFADEPLAQISEHAYMVKGDKRTLWKEYEPSGFEKLKKMFLSREFLMFLLVGVINTFSNVLFSAVYLAVLQVLIPGNPREWYTNIAFYPGYLTSNVTAYLLNSFLTFKQKLGFVKYLKFFASYIPNLIIQGIIVGLYTKFINGPGVIAYAAAAVIGVPVTFVFMKIFAFRKSKE